MKRKLALLLAAVMVAAMVPVSAFAKTDNHVTKTVIVEKDAYLTTDAPVLELALKDGLSADTPFELVLDGAEWKLPAANGEYPMGAITVSSATPDVDYVVDSKIPSHGAAVKVGAKGTYKVVTGGTTFNVVLLDAQTLSVEVDTAITATTGVFKLPLWTKVTGDEATVTVVDNNSEVSAGTYTFATSTTAAATVKSQGMVDVEIDGAAKELKSIVVTETVKGALDTVAPGNEINFKLYGDFEFDLRSARVVSTEDTSNLDGVITPVGTANKEFKVTLSGAGSTTAAKLSLTGIKVVDDGAKAGDVAEIVVKGAGVDTTTIEVAKAITYGVSFTAADKKLPVFYSGRFGTKETLEVTFKELAEDSWWAARKTTLTFPEGVKVTDVDFTGDVVADGVTANVTWKNNVVTIAGGTYTDTDKAEWKADFELSISPDFTGDITCTVGGPAVKEDITVVVGEAQYPVTFEVEVSDVSIDYRNVAVGDITIKETFAGALEDGKDLFFFVDSIGLEGGAKVEILEGDIEVELEEEDNMLWINVTEESYKAPSVIKITGVEAYLERSLPAGSYALEVGGLTTVGNVTSVLSDAIFQNWADKNTVKTATTAGWFNVSSYELADAYIEVVTAGRDQDDSSFTTAVKVTVGANEMAVGQGTVALEVPAYIANGYTMLPVRAVADALSNDAATVIWNGETKTVTIAFGARIISMTIGSKVMNINGVEIGMNAAPEITNNRTFLPLRDLGYALGLTDADIAWDDTTKTATLN